MNAPPGRSDAPSRVAAPRNVRAVPSRWLRADIVFVVAMVVLQCAMPRLVGQRGARMLLISATGAALLLALLIGLLPRRARTGAYVATWVATATLLYIDVVYYRQFEDFPTYAAIFRGPQLRGMTSAVWPLLRPADLIIVAAVLFVAAAMVVLPRAPSPPLSRRVRAIGLAVAVVAIALPWDPRRGLLAPWASHEMVVRYAGLLSYHAEDVARAAKRTIRGIEGSPDVAARAIAATLTRYHADRNAADPATTMRFPPGFARGMNVVVVQLESVQRFVIGRTVDGKPIAPFLTQLARENLYFENFYSEAGEGHTADADLLVNCSAYPTTRGVAYVDYETAAYACLPHELRNAGYRTVAFHGYDGSYWNRRTMYAKLGFDRFYDITHFTGDAVEGLGIPDVSFMHRVASDLQALPRPFYAFVVTLSSHSPFDWPGLPGAAALLARNAGSAELYANAVHYADSAVRDLFADLDRRGLRDSTIVLLYGDHAGITRSADGFSATTGVPAGDDVQAMLAENQVPLIVVMPRSLPAAMREPRTIAQAAGEVDVGPSILHALGLPIPPWFFGVPIWTDGPRIEAMHGGAVASGTSLWFDSRTGPMCLHALTPSPIGECEPFRAVGEALRDASDAMITRDLLPRVRGLLRPRAAGDTAETGR